MFIWLIVGAAVVFTSLTVGAVATAKSSKKEDTIYDDNPDKNKDDVVEEEQVSEDIGDITKSRIRNAIISDEMLNNRSTLKKDKKKLSSDVVSFNNSDIKLSDELTKKDEIKNNDDAEDDDSLEEESKKEKEYQFDTYKLIGRFNEEFTGKKCKKIINDDCNNAEVCNVKIKVNGEEITKTISFDNVKQINGNFTEGIAELDEDFAMHVVENEEKFVYKFITNDENGILLATDFDDNCTVPQERRVILIQGGVIYRYCSEVSTNEVKALYTSINNKDVDCVDARFLYNDEKLKFKEMNGGKPIMANINFDENTKFTINYIKYNDEKKVYIVEGIHEYLDPDASDARPEYDAVKDTGIFEFQNAFDIFNEKKIKFEEGKRENKFLKDNYIIREAQVKDGQYDSSRSCVIDNIDNNYDGGDFSYFSGKYNFSTGEAEGAIYKGELAKYKYFAGKFDVGFKLKKGKEYDKEGNLIYEGEFQRNTKKGEFSLYIKDGVKFCNGEINANGDFLKIELATKHKINEDDQQIFELKNIEFDISGKVKKAGEIKYQSKDGKTKYLVKDAELHEGKLTGKIYFNTTVVLENQGDYNYYEGEIDIKNITDPDAITVFPKGNVELKREVQICTYNSDKNECKYAQMKVLATGQYKDNGTKFEGTVDYSSYSPGLKLEGTFDGNFNVIRKNKYSSAQDSDIKVKIGDEYYKVTFDNITLDADCGSFPDKSECIIAKKDSKIITYSDVTIWLNKKNQKDRNIIKKDSCEVRYQNFDKQDFYIGAINSGVPDGQGKMKLLTESGVLYFVGTFKDGKPKNGQLKDSNQTVITVDDCEVDENYEPKDLKNYIFVKSNFRYKLNNNNQLNIGDIKDFICIYDKKDTKEAIFVPEDKKNNIKVQNNKFVFTEGIDNVTVVKKKDNKLYVGECKRDFNTSDFSEDLKIKNGKEYNFSVTNNKYKATLTYEGTFNANEKYNKGKEHKEDGGTVEYDNGLVVQPVQPQQDQVDNAEQQVQNAENNENNNNGVQEAPVNENQEDNNREVNNNNGQEDNSSEENNESRESDNDREERENSSNHSEEDGVTEITNPTYVWYQQGENIGNNVSKAFFVTNGDKKLCVWLKGIEAENKTIIKGTAKYMEKMKILNNSLQDNIIFTLNGEFSEDDAKKLIQLKDLEVEMYGKTYRNTTSFNVKFKNNSNSLLQISDLKLSCDSGGTLKYNCFYDINKKQLECSNDAVIQYENVLLNDDKNTKITYYEGAVLNGLPNGNNIMYYEQSGTKFKFVGLFEKGLPKKGTIYKELEADRYSIIDENVEVDEYYNVKQAQEQVEEEHTENTNDLKIDNLEKTVTINKRGRKVVISGNYTDANKNKIKGKVIFKDLTDGQYDLTLEGIFNYDGNILTVCNDQQYKASGLLVANIEDSRFEMKLLDHLVNVCFNENNSYITCDDASEFVEHEGLHREIVYENVKLDFLEKCVNISGSDCAITYKNDNGIEGIKRIKYNGVVVNGMPHDKGEVTFVANGKELKFKGVFLNGFPSKGTLYDKETVITSQDCDFFGYHGSSNDADMILQQYKFNNNIQTVPLGGFNIRGYYDNNNKPILRGIYSILNYSTTINTDIINNATLDLGTLVKCIDKNKYKLEPLNSNCITCNGTGRNIKYENCSFDVKDKVIESINENSKMIYNGFPDSNDKYVRQEYIGTIKFSMPVRGTMKLKKGNVYYKFYGDFQDGKPTKGTLSEWETGKIIFESKNVNEDFNIKISVDVDTNLNSNNLQNII